MISISVTRFPCLNVHCSVGDFVQRELNRQKRHGGTCGTPLRNVSLNVCGKVFQKLEAELENTLKSDSFFEITSEQT